MTFSTWILARVAMIVAAGLTFALTPFAAASPAHAATMTSVSVTTATPLVAGQQNAASVVVTFTTVTAMPSQNANSAVANLLGATWVSTPVSFGCGSMVSVANDQSLNTVCAANPSNVNGQAMVTPAAVVPANTTWTVTFAPNSFVAPNAASLSVRMATFVATSGGAQYDSASATLPITGYTAPAKNVTFDANGGSGTMTTQSGSAAAALTANAFTRSGYSFAGWNTAADGSGTAYADGASYAFTANTTLYAQWAPSLATTGVDSGPTMMLLALALVAVSAGAVLLARTRRS